MLARYLWKEMLTPFLAWTGLLCVLLFVMAFLRGTDFLLGSAVTVGDYARFLAALLPQFVVQAIPISLMLSILTGLGRLSEDRELVAIQALGLAPSSFMWAPLALGLSLSLVLSVLASTLQPWGMATLRQVAHDIIRRNLVTDIRSGTFHEEVEGYTVYAEQVAAGNRWTNVLLYDGRDLQTPLLAVAATGQVVADDALASVIFDLRRGSVHRAGRENDEYTVIDFEKGAFRANVEEAFFQKNNFRSNVEEQTPFEMWRDIVSTRERGEPVGARLSRFHFRVGQVAMPLAFAFLATPLALTRRGGGRGRGVLLTLLGYAVYYLLARVAVQSAEAEKLAPWLAGQASNIVFVAVGIVIIAWVNRRGAA